MAGIDFFKIIIRAITALPMVIELAMAVVISI